MIDIDLKIIAKCQSGDIDAFAYIVDYYKEPIIGFIGRFLGNWSQAEDIAQEIFLRLYSKISKYDINEKAKFSTWLFTLAKNACIDILRKNKHDFVPLDSISEKELSCQSETIKQNIYQEQIGNYISKAVESLPIDQRMAFILKEYQDLSCEEVATICNCNAGTIKSRLSRAKEKLRKKLEGVFDEYFNQ